MIKPQIEKFNTEQRKFLTTAQGVVEIRMASPDSQSIKVLALSGDAQVTSYECLVKEAVFGGRVNVKMLFHDDDGNVSCLNYNADFSEKFGDNNISPDTKLTFNCVVTDIVPAEPLGNSVTIQCVLETRIYADIHTETSCVTDCEARLKKETIAVSEMLFSQERGFTVIEEASAKSDVAKILLAEGKAIVSSVTAEENMVTVKGEAYATVTFQTADKSFETMVVAMPFNEEISARGCVPDAIVRANAFVKNTKLHMEISENGDNRNFTVECEINISLKGFRKSDKEVVVDAFSLDEEINIVGESVTASFPHKYFSHTHRVDGTLQIGDMPKPDRIFCGVCPRVVILGCSAYSNEIVLEGILSGNLLYSSEDKPDSTTFEVPFVVNLDYEGINPDAQIHCDAVITDVIFKMGRGDSAEIAATVKFGFNIHEDSTGFVIRELSAGGKKEKIYCAIETLMVKKGMTLWDMEKFLNLSGEEILHCNPDLELPLTGDRKVIVFRQLRD